MADSLQEQLLQLLQDTLSTDQEVRKTAESHLLQIQTNDGFPTSLASIASHTTVPPDVRQAALLVLKTTVQSSWAGLDEGLAPRYPISEANKELLRTQLLEIAIGNGDVDDRKVQSVASLVVSKIASVDFPEAWPSLLPTLLHVIPSANDNQLHGALRVLTDLVEDSLSEDQFFGVARDIVNVVYAICVSDVKKDIHKALAVQVFRNTFDIMDIVKDEHGEEIRGFADEIIKGWSPFFLDTMKKPLPMVAAVNAQQPDEWRGIIALKLQIVKTLMKIRTVFPQLLLPQSPLLFSTTWAELTLLAPYHKTMYIENDMQGRLEDSDHLPYTLDFLVLEELDFLQSCIRASPVQHELEAQLQANAGVLNTPWVMDVMKLAVAYAQIPNEDEGLWGIDVNLFLAEETSVTANYNARAACGDLLIKLGEWLHQGALEGLLAYTKVLFAIEGSGWRTREAALFLLTQLMSDFLDVDKPVAPELIVAYLEFIDYAINQQEPLLRARGYLVAGILVQAAPAESFPVTGLLDRTIKAINDDNSEVVKVACMKATQGYTRSNIGASDRQVHICSALSDFLHGQDLTDLEDSDDLLVMLVESLGAAINLNPNICIVGGSNVLDLLFVMAKHGASNIQLTMLVHDTFEHIVEELSSASHDAYAAICEKVLPSLTGAFDVGDMTLDDPLKTLATELLCALTEAGSEPLPPGYIAATMPKLNRMLMNTDEGALLRPGSETIKFMLMHDHQQVFAWNDGLGKSGLEICLIIIDRLLNPAMEDNSASEVGGLAAELVEKAGQERLGPFLPQLLQAVATRLATAEAPPFIQSLILVFARLSLVGAQDVVAFLSQIQINGQSGLQLVLSKWLEHSVHFAGYDEIRQNVIALSKLYSLNDPRLVQTLVKGDLIIPTSNRIKTRSQTKLNPDKYTIIPAPLKIIKVLIEELLSASGRQPDLHGAANAALQDEDLGDDDGWEDVPSSVLDLGLGSTKAELMAWSEGTGLFQRQRDDETQTYLIEFFTKASRENTAGFSEIYGSLTEDEKRKLSELAGQS